jgi:hypothetical protein
MALALIGGPWTWGAGRDDEGHRTYNVTHKLSSTEISATEIQYDGPAAVIGFTGLPQIGDTWNFGSDVDVYAYCTPFMSVKPDQQDKGDPVSQWRVDQKFTTKPMNRCQDTNIEDPLMEPDKISGDFQIYTREMVTDKDGALLTNSAHELFRGPMVEFDDMRATVVITQNRADLELPLLAQLANRVNDASLWGVASRSIKFTPGPWSIEYFGVCDFYYKRTLNFDINFETHDRTLLDEGTKALHGHWEGDDWVLDLINGAEPDPDNPAHFDRYKDRNDENVRVMLNGAGLPTESAGQGFGTSTGTAVPTVGSKNVQYYQEGNFLTLGIPTALTG